MSRQRVLFLCTHNSARSQMAEGLLRQLGGERFESFSAGTEATHVRPLAIRAMGELGIDIAGQESKTLDRYLPEPFDYVITVCDQANASCPSFPGGKTRLHWSLPDPSQARGTEAEQLAVYRGVRDELRTLIETQLLPRGGQAASRFSCCRPRETRRLSYQPPILLSPRETHRLAATAVRVLRSPPSPQAFPRN